MSPSVGGDLVTGCSAGLRERGPVSRVRYRGLDGWLVTGHEAVRRALVDSRLTANQAYATSASQLGWAAGGQVLDPDDARLLADAPAYGGAGGAVGESATTGRIEALRPAVEGAAALLIDRFAGHGHADLVAQFTVPLAGAAVMELLGVPPGRRSRFDTWIRRAGRPEPDQLHLVPRAWARLSTLMVEVIREQGVDPSDNLLSAPAGAGSGDDERGVAAARLLIMGHLATTDLLGRGMHALLRDPDRRAAVAADASLIPAVVEELLRSAGPASNVLIRYAAEDLPIGGVTVAAGEAVVLVLGAAALDPAGWAEGGRPDPWWAGGAVWVDQAARHPLTASLARLVAQVGFAALLRRLPGLAFGCDPDDLVWRQGRMTHGLLALPVTFRPG